MSDAGRFDGRTAVVTGAGSGIGRATAVRLASEGARVVVADLAADRLAALAAEHPDLAFVPVAADISTQSGVDAVVDAAGAVDLLANVAGILDGFRTPLDMTDDVWERVFAVNITAVMRMTRACLPSMIERGRGAIVNVSSAAGLRASAGGAAYTASKHAVIGFTRSTALMHRADGVRANAVAPGGVVTNIETTFASPIAAERLLPVMLAVGGDMAAPETIAGAITFLLSDDAANVNGTVLSCDGGWAAI